MSHESDRDALFGPVKAGGLKHKANASANRDALFGPVAGEEKKKKRAPNNKSKATPSSMSSSASATSTARPMSSSSSGSAKNPTTARRLASSSAGRTGGTLTGAARVQKLKDAEELRAKAKKAMAKGFFSSPDPLAASNYYRRAADAYKQCGEFQLERVHRVASADSQMAQQAYATAATEYARAAEIVAQEETNDQTDLEIRRNQVYQLYCKASDAWQQMGNTQKAGQALLDAALGLLLTDDDADAASNSANFMQMERRGLTAMEEAVEAFVPDVLNRYRSYRQTGTSSFVNGDTGEGDVELARHHMVKHAYGHEPLQRAVNIFVSYQEYRSALYAAGAASALLEADPHVTITLHRSYIVETILALAMGDVVAANQYFTSVHLQKSSYLTSRECKLAEECIRAIQQYDEEALEEALSRQGSNRAAVANLDANIREVALHLRVRGTVSKTRKDGSQHHSDGHKKKSSSTKKKKSRPPAEKVGDETDVKEVQEVQASIEETIAELDNLMGDMGLDKDDDAYDPDNPDSHSRPAPAKYTVDDQDDFEDDDDDDIDLR